MKDKLNQIKITDKENLRLPQKVLSSTTKSTFEEENISSTISMGSHNLMISTYL